MSDKPLLKVEDLSVRFPSHRGVVEAVRGISFEIGRAKVGIVGESGSGKSMTGRAVMRLIPKPGEVSARRLEFDGIDIQKASEAEMRRIRGRRIGLIMQDPRYSLNPVLTVGDQIAEACRIHSDCSRKEARRRALSMLESVRIRDPETVYRQYPHQVSGGMGQRIMIAMMLAPNPDLVIADEPTSSLDVTVRMQVLALLDDLVMERGMGLLFISHDLNLVAGFCDWVLIMYAGRIVERCRASELYRAQHPYTRALLESLPQIDRPREELPVMVRDPSWAV
jgi:peptide/nickel transport system ATP-binding protein